MKEKISQNREGQEALERQNGANVERAEVFDATQEVAESAREVLGEVSEQESEGSEQGSQGGKGAAARISFEERLEQEVASMDEPKMRHSVEKKLKDEIKQTERQIYFLGVFPRRMPYHKLNALIIHLRALRERLREISDMAFDMLKALYRQLRMSEPRGKK